MFFIRGNYYTVGNGGQFLGPYSGQSIVSVATDGHWIDYITIPVSFTGVPVTGTLPLTVDFTDTTVIPSGYVLDYHIWQFGDGNTASGYLPNTSHIYNSPGSYNVTLKIKVCEE